MIEVYLVATLLCHDHGGNLPEDWIPVMANGIQYEVVLTDTELMCDPHGNALFFEVSR